MYWETKEEWRSEWLHEQLSQVENERWLAVTSHCTNNSRGEYTLRVNLMLRDKCVSDPLLGEDALEFMRELKNGLED